MSDTLQRWCWLGPTHDFKRLYLPSTRLGSLAKPLLLYDSDISKPPKVFPVAGQDAIYARTGLEKSSQMLFLLLWPQTLQQALSSVEVRCTNASVLTLALPLASHVTLNK